MIRLFENEVENMRDLGGYKNIENKEILYNKFIRSNFIEKLSENSIKELIKNNVKTIIDLRSKDEIKAKKGIFFNNEYFDYFNIEINGGGRIPENTNMIVDSYIEMIEGKEAICKVFKTIINSKGGVIYYCNAGKDRTGMITALILKVLGIDDELIVDDYILSGIYLEKVLNEFAKINNDSNILQIITPKRDTILVVLDYIRKEYKSVENYLNLIGITNEEIRKLKEIAFNSNK